MPFLDAVRLALAQIRVQKLKSFFTILGVTIGVMFLIAVVSIVEGMSHYMEHDFIGKLIGLNSFELRRRPNITAGNVTEATIREWRRRPRILDSDIEPVASALPFGSRWAAYSEQDNVAAESPYVHRPRKVTLTMIEGDFFGIRKMGVAAGRVFAEQEMARGEPVVVIGQEVATALFPGIEAVGRDIKIGGEHHRVVGVAERQGTIFGISLDKFIVAPMRSSLHRLVTNPHGSVQTMVIQSPTTPQMEEAMERVRQIMRGRHRLRPVQPDNFSLQTAETALDFWKKIKAVLVVVGIALPAISLVVGALVIMNIMLVAVAERTREIGIRKALGARRRDILSQFLVESATLSTIGAGIGITLGIAISQIIAANFPALPAVVAPFWLATAVVVGAGVGIIAGSYPATRAARLDPIAALRQE